jgi:uncharacterized protein (TIGR02117 family)
MTGSADKAGALTALLRYGAGLLGALLAFALLYLLTAWIAGRIPLNRDFQPDPDGIPVYLVSNGAHVDVVIPVSGDCACGPARAPIAAILQQTFDLRMPRERWHWLAVGWGDAAFMLTVPTWSDLTPGIALRAVTGLDDSVLRISTYGEPRLGPRVRRLQLTPFQYQRLLAYMYASLRAPLQEKTSGMAGPEDRFYLSRDRYSLFNSCNEWVSKGLAQAGIRTALWSPFEGALLHQADRAR